HPDLLALHPSGPGGVLAEFQRSMDDLASAGATYVDLTDGFTVDQFLTVVNMNQTGRLMITERLAEALG
ncbi:MAG: hypothetical protein OEW42_02595, partial [Acidimicrobiia bacterium]|nr:hypothetical protein [Acidimicrobiia bacterium]